MLGGLDLAFFLIALVGVLIVGLVAGRREETTEDYYLAGRSLPWWGVAGSIFATNVSANHLIGMLGVGFSIGFAQSHYELGSVFALLVLAYLLLPVYEHLRVYTLSQYLARRYDEVVALLYTVVTLLLIVVQMAALFYIGSRSMGLLLRDTPLDLGYVGGIAALALVTSVYTIFGGLKAVVWTDVLQSVLLLIAGILVAVLTFAQDEIGGFAGLLELDARQPPGRERMTLTLPSSHPDLPWTGAFTGLMALHLSFWGTNQYIVQRTLAARSLRQARIGILAGGFLKLLVPFFSIAGGVAAAYLFAERMPDVTVAPDEAFPILMSLVVPAGHGWIGLIAAGLLGAILSTLDSMMNSAATLAVFDVYRKHVDPAADDARLILVGRVVIAAIVVLSASMAAITWDPASRGNFFLNVSRQISYLTPGLLVAFLMGMFVPHATARGAVVAILLAPVFGGLVEHTYDALAPGTAVARVLGERLNFMHRTIATVLACAAAHAAVSRSQTGVPLAQEGTFTFSAGVGPDHLRRLAVGLATYVIGNAGLATGMEAGLWPRWLAAWLGAGLTIAIFAAWIARERRSASSAHSLLRDDRLLAGLLAAATTAILFGFA